MYLITIEASVEKETIERGTGSNFESDKNEKCKRINES